MWHCSICPLHAGHAAIDRYLLPAMPTAADLQQWHVLAGWDGFIDPAPHTMRAIPRTTITGKFQRLQHFSHLLLYI